MPLRQETDRQSDAGQVSTAEAADPRGSGWAHPARAGWVAITLLATAILLHAYVLLRTAWLCDDAYITFRTVDNFVNGYGLTWNVDERVQAYTHPLWMFLLSSVYWFTREAHYTAIFTTMALSLTAVMIYCLRIARTMPQAIVGVLILVFSKCFVDYSTGGLENPLTYLLLAVFFAIYLRDRALTGGRLFALSLVACLGVLNRMDTLLLFGPALLEAWWRSRQTASTAANSAGVAPETYSLTHSRDSMVTSGFAKRQLRRDENNVTPSASSGQAMAPGKGSAGMASGRFTLSPCLLVSLSAVLGFLPFLAWEVFSVIYYGFAFPNTAYAKLNTGIPAMELAGRGLQYLRDSLAKDPLTLVTIAGGIVAAAVWQDRRRTAIALGSALYVLYVVKIGGDFMSGRFLAAPLLAAVILLSSLPVRLTSANWVSAGLLAAAVGFAAPYPSILTTNRYGIAWCWNFDNSHIADERAYYYPTTGLLADTMGMETPSQHVIDVATHRRQEKGLVTGMGTIGMYGYYIGPENHVIDMFALADPLLARLPMIYKPNWRIGHFVRHVPEGYIERLQSLREKEAAATQPATQQPIVENRFADPDIEAFHNALCLITRGPLFSWQRWQAIWNMNLGRYDCLIDKRFYRNPPERVWLGEVNGGPKPRGIARDLPRIEGCVPLPARGFIVILPGRMHAAHLEVSLDGNGDFRIDYPQLGRRPVTQEIPAASDQPGQVVRRIDVPAEVITQGYERFRIYPARPETGYRMRYVRPVENGTP